MIVAMSTMTTAPGQNCRLIGVGPRTWLSSTSTGATKSAICAALPSAMPTLRSSRFLRAPENADAISAAAPDERHHDEADERRRHAELGEAPCTDSTNTSLTSATSTVTADQRRERQADRPRRFAAPRACSAPAKNSRCVLSENTRPSP